MIIFASAKINLCLDIIEKHKSGYHKIQTVYKEIKSLQNKVTIKAKTDNSNMSRANTPQSETCKMAIQIMHNSFTGNKIPQIEIVRNIPFSSGLGGESSNAAAIIKGLNVLWDLNLSNNQLREIAEKIGMDVSFFIEGGTAIGSNFGEKITQLDDINLDLEIFAKSSELKNKTKTAFSNIDLSKCGKNKEKTKKLIEAIKQKDLESIKGNIHNDFELIYKINNGEFLSGAGPSTFKLK